MKYLRYRGEFLSVAGTVWRAEIWQEAEAAFAQIGALEFDADEPLVIEWSGKSKEEVICGSAATLKIVSPGDRTYEDLYSIEVGRVRLDVYRDNTLYWSGCIDTEFYEEPYEQACGYTVTLTFADFGVLDRLKYDGVGMPSIEDVVSYAIYRSGIYIDNIEEYLISTKILPTGEAMRLRDIKVRADNFYDEDGEASTLAEVVEGVLQPLALRMVQRGGRVYVYDLNALYEQAERKPIEWDGDSQTMGVDAVYNNAKITWSPYAQEGNLAVASCWREELKTDASLVALNNLQGVTKGDATYWSYHYSADLWDWLDATDCGFTLWVSKLGNGAELVNDAVKFFKTVPQYDGAEGEGIAISWGGYRGYKVDNGSGWSAELEYYPHGAYPPKLAGPIRGKANVGGILYKTDPVWLPPVDDPNTVQLRVKMELLMDPRFNPFESAAKILKGEDEASWYDQFNKHGNFVYVPVTIKFKPDGSDAVYVWGNREIILNLVGDNPVTTLAGTYGSWQLLSENADGTNPNAWGYLAYYSVKDREDSCGVLGWKANRPAINPHREKVTSVLNNVDDGQYLPYPRYGGKGGELWVELRTKGWYIGRDRSALIADENGAGNKELWNKVRWILAKLPEVEILNGAQFGQEIKVDDVEYQAQLLPDAKEPIEIDTVCGTSAEGIPTARGAYYKRANGLQVKTLTRAGRTSQAEDLLIGTLYSQYAQRRTKLSGEAVILHDPMAVYTEANQEGKVFLATEDVQDVRMDVSDAVFVEFRPDEYKRTNE